MSVPVRDGNIIFVFQNKLDSRAAAGIYCSVYLDLEMIPSQISEAR